MPKGYMIFTEDIRDDAGIGVYAQQAVPTVLQAGGRILVVDDACELVEGSWHGKRRPRGIGTGRLNIKGSWVSVTPPRTATQ